MERAQDASRMLAALHGKPKKVCEWNMDNGRKTMKVVIDLSGARGEGDEDLVTWLASLKGKYFLIVSRSDFSS